MRPWGSSAEAVHRGVWRALVLRVAVVCAVAVAALWPGAPAGAEEGETGISATGFVLVRAVLVGAGEGAGAPRSATVGLSCVDGSGGDVGRLAVDVPGEAGIPVPEGSRCSVTVVGAGEVAEVATEVVVNGATVTEGRSEAAFAIRGGVDHVVTVRLGPGGSATDPATGSIPVPERIDAGGGGTAGAGWPPLLALVLPPGLVLALAAGVVVARARFRGPRGSRRSRR